MNSNGSSPVDQSIKHRAKISLRACDDCQRMKSRCNGSPDSSCSNCISLGRPCTFLTPRRKRGPKNKRTQSQFLAPPAQQLCSNCSHHPSSGSISIPSGSPPLLSNQYSQFNHGYDLRYDTRSVQEFMTTLRSTLPVITTCELLDRYAAPNKSIYLELLLSSMASSSAVWNSSDSSVDGSWSWFSNTVSALGKIPPPEHFDWDYSRSMHILAYIQNHINSKKN